MRILYFLQHAYMSIKLKRVHVARAHTISCCNLSGSPSYVITFGSMCAAGLQPQMTQPTAQSSGLAPLVRSAVLTDRRHILTQDADGNVQLWDVATAAVEQHFGKVIPLVTVL